MPYFRALCYFTQAAGADHEFSCSSVTFHKDAELVIAFKIVDHLYDWTIAGIGTVIEDGAAAVSGISFKQIWIGKTTDFSGIMARSLVCHGCCAGQRNGVYMRNWRKVIVLFKNRGLTIRNEIPIISLN